MEHKNPYAKFIRLEPLLHLFLWGMVLLYPYIKYIKREGGYAMSFAHEINALFLKMSISYFLYFWFFPRLNQRRYYPLALLALVFNTLLYEYTDRFFHPADTHFWQHFATNLLTHASFGVIFFTLFSVKNIYRQQLSLDALQQEKNQAEMSALKAQINPHFLFNTLNTIYANALKKEENTPELILKLSDGFRYLFHEGQQERVSLQRELQHLKDYIQLQEERLADKVDVHFSTEVIDSTKQIAPLLLIPFVENAFKYTSLLKGKNHQINIAITATKTEFSFQCMNPFDTSGQHELDSGWATSGVGITNVKRRLDLLYPQKHELEIMEEGNRYSVKLTILV